MKPGADNPKKVIITAGLLVFALVLFAYMVFDKDSPATASGFSVKQPRIAVKTNPRYDLNPSLRADLLRASEGPVYGGTGRNIFKAEPDIIPPPPLTCAPLGGPSHGLKWCEGIGPPPPPPLPPINLKFFGFASKPGEPKKVFLSQGDDIFIASEGDIVDRRYKIVRINATTVDIEDVLNNNKQPVKLTS